MRTNIEFQYLVVDNFIQSLIDAQSLKTSFELGLIDFLIQYKHSSFRSLQIKLNLNGQSLKFLLDLLKANQVIEGEDENITLSQDFIHALSFRDLLEAKLDFTDLVLPDFYKRFTLLISKPGEFMQHSNVFDLFRYDRCFEASDENMEKTRRWVRLTTCLTKYESQACIKYHDFNSCKQVLDIGGNSGEFVLHLCKNYPLLQATVFDLPLVCEIGKENISSTPEAERIQFIKGDIREESLPRGYDLILFKSFLHDWPECDACQLIKKASEALQPGGTILIFERGPIEIEKKTPPYSLLPIMTFFQCFREPALYTEQLKALNFHSISQQRIDLDMPFYMITAKKVL